MSINVSSKSLFKAKKKKSLGLVNIAISMLGWIIEIIFELLKGLFLELCH